MKPADAPRLDDWVNATEIAQVLGTSRQTVNLMIHNGEFKTLHKKGTEGKPQFYIRRTELDKVAETREFPRSKGRLPEGATEDDVPLFEELG